VFVIDGKDHDQQCNDNGMEMASSTVKRNSDRWIPFRIPMTIRSESRQEECKDGGQISGVRSECRVRPSLDPGEPARSLKC
jgi:hypothetical protein